MSSYVLSNLALDRANFWKLEQELEKMGYTYISEGSTRQVFVSRHKTHVIKVLTSSYNDHKDPAERNANVNEYNAYKKFAKTNQKNRKAKFARCKLISNELLLMEYVTPFTDAWQYAKHRRKPLPQWTKTFSTVDGYQVGYNAKRKLVAYDYGYPANYNKPYHW